MKSILHLDYWVEVPAGEFFAGLSPQNVEIMRSRMQQQFLTDYFPYWKKRLLEARPGLNLDWRSRYLDRFYIARFPITYNQLASFYEGKPVDSIPGALEETTTITSRGAKIRPGMVAKVLYAEAEMILKALGARLPTSMEWEKVTRGTDDRLYPWGNDWDPNAGYFYRGQSELARIKDRVDAFPRGTSPYGVYGVVGYLPQLVGSFPWPGARGCDPAETTAERAWIDNIIPIAAKARGYHCLRPVLDKWPQQQWRGYRAGKNENI